MLCLLLIPFQKSTMPSSSPYTRLSFSPSIMSSSLPTITTTEEDLCQMPDHRDEIIKSKILSTILPNSTTHSAQNNPDSIQYQALNYILTNDTSINPCSKELLERYILTIFYHSMNGYNWNDNTNWLYKDSSICDWFGITCEKNDDFIGVTEINLGKCSIILYEQLNT